MVPFESLGAVSYRGAPEPDPDPDPAGYPVNFVDPVQIQIRPDPETVDPDPARSKISGSGSCWILLKHHKH